jgi:endonuclease/exonuclease/phosphatase family metal-dependent hydrolase
VAVLRPGEGVSRSRYAGPMVDDTLIGPTPGPQLHVMTFNIRRRFPHISPRNPDLWSLRKPVLRRLLSREQPSLLGLQEVLPDQEEFLQLSLGMRYRSIGYGRAADRRGEACPIFYDTTRLRLVDWTQLALSDTPEVAGSRSFGNLLPRILVSARFEDLVTGHEFLALNMHLDHLSAKSRLRSAEMIRALVDAAGCPVVVTGDANAGVRSAPFRLLTGDGLLRDTWAAARMRLSPPFGTNSRYRAPKVRGRRIDWILVSGGFVVDKVGINPYRHRGHAASDHDPVQSVLRFAGDPGAESSV